MNAYIIVEGDKTETNVYPAWLSILSPRLQRVENANDATENCYYLFSGAGQPNIFAHTAKSVADVNAINASGMCHYDYIMVCLDTEEESRAYIESQIESYMREENVTLDPSTKLMIFEQKVSMETWFLGNRKVYHSQPQDPEYIKYQRYFNVSKGDPEDMGEYDPDKFNKAGFHLKYLRKMLQERRMVYNKNNTQEVEKVTYLNELIRRYEETGHLKTFGSWYEFVVNNLNP